MEGLSIKLPAELRQRLADEARRRNVSQSAIVRECIEQALANERKGQPPLSCAAIVRDLTGSVHSGRNDLATNKATLEEAMLEGGRSAPERHR